MDDRGASLTQTERAHLPRYFFNVEDDRTIIDQEGTDLPNLRAAREEAVSTSAELLRERAGGFPLERKTLGDVGYGPSWRNGRNATQAPVFCDRRRGRGHYQRGYGKMPASLDDTIRHYIENHLYTTAAIALGLGWLIGRPHRPF
jgi:hypothetical protein